MCCLHHVGWRRGTFTHSSLPSQFFLGNVRLSLNQHNFFPIPGLGHTKVMPVSSVNYSSLGGENSLCAGWSLPESLQTAEGRWGSLWGQGGSSGHLLNRRFVTLQELQNGLEGATKTCGWLCLPGLLADGLCVG